MTDYSFNLSFNEREINLKINRHVTRFARVRTRVHCELHATLREWLAGAPYASGSPHLACMHLPISEYRCTREIGKSKTVQLVSNGVSAIATHWRASEVRRAPAPAGTKSERFCLLISLVAPPLITTVNTLSEFCV